MKCCVSTDDGTWTNWLTFEPDPDYSPHAGTGLLSLISYALQCGILLRRENPTVTHCAAATRGFTMVLFTASRRNNFVGGTCALPSALLVLYKLGWCYGAIFGPTKFLINSIGCLFTFCAACVLNIVDPSVIISQFSHWTVLLGGVA